MPPLTPQEEFGPLWRSIQFVRDVHVPMLDKRRAESILLMARLNEHVERNQRHAFEAARKVPDRERQMVAASEMLRKEIWEVVWDSSWADAWHMSWVISRLGIGLATLDLVALDDSKYEVFDYTSLAGPWLTGGFSDIRFNYEEGKDVA